MNDTPEVQAQVSAANAAPAGGAGSPALMNTYARSELAFERGEGAWLYATDGQRFLDFASGIAVTALGHCHPHLVKALTSSEERRVGKEGDRTCRSRLSASY